MIKLKLQNLYKFNSLFCLANLIYFIPLSIILGNAIININVLLINVLFIYCFFKKKLFIEYKKLVFFLIILTGILLINCLFSVSLLDSLKSSLGLLRYYILFFAIFYCLVKYKKFESNFSKVCFIILCLVLMDTLFQYFNKEDIFGFKISTSHGNRLSGPFGDEYVVGSFIGKLIFLSLLFISNFKKKFLFTSIFLLIGLLITILSNERASSIMLFITVIIFFIFYKPQNYIKFFFIFIIILSVFFLVTKNQNIYNHFYLTIKKHYSDNHWKAHFLTSIEIYKNNKFLGSGLKTFRVECKNPEYEKINTKYVNSRCANHPHNIYFEVLSDGGLLLFLYFILINLFLGLKQFYRACLEKRNIRQLIIFCSFFILYWPLQTTGSIFSTWNGIFYWISLAFIVKEIVSNSSYTK